MEEQKKVLDALIQQQCELWDTQEEEMITKEASSMPQKGRLWHKYQYVKYTPCPLWKESRIIALCSNPNCWNRNEDNISECAHYPFVELLSTLTPAYIMRVIGRRLFACSQCYLIADDWYLKNANYSDLEKSTEEYKDKYEEYILDTTRNVPFPISESEAGLEAKFLGMNIVTLKGCFECPICGQNNEHAPDSHGNFGGVKDCGHGDHKYIISFAWDEPSE